MAAFTHTLSLATNPPTAVNVTATAAAIASGGSGGVQVSITFDDGSNQYTLKGSQSQILEVLRQAMQAVPNAPGLAV